MLALIAGQGRLPAQVAAAAAAPVIVTNVAGYQPDGLTPEFDFKLERIASFFSALHDRGVSEVCFAGAVRRPGFDPTRVDDASLQFVERIVGAAQKGDDGALRTLLLLFEEAGFVIRAAQDIAPNLLPEAGAQTDISPTRDDDEEAIRAVAVLNALGPLDVGQSCVVHMGQVLALEAGFGTDWMLQTLTMRPDGRGGLLYKAPKPGQDRRIDFPVIGPETVDAAAAAGLSGIAIEAGGVMLLDRDESIRRADAAGMFIWARRL
ncbi:MAG: LpxI family protein [Boseongicola sp.]